MRPRSHVSMGIPTVVVPVLPGVFSALGILLADIRVDKVWTQAFRSTDVDASRVAREFRRIAQLAVDELGQEGFVGEPKLRRAITMRYLGQNYEHEVEIAGGEVGEEGLEAALRSFDRLHTERYGYAIEGETIELLSFRVTAVGQRAPLDLGQGVGTGSDERSHRSVLFRGVGFCDAEIVQRSSLVGGSTLSGPAIVEEAGATTLLEPGMTGDVAAEGSLIIDTGVAA